MAISSTALIQQILQEERLIAFNFLKQANIEINMALNLMLCFNLFCTDVWFHRFESSWKIEALIRQLTHNDAWCYCSRAFLQPFVIRF